MYVERLRLTNFRCYREADISLPPGPVVVAGANAQGKSSLLEAVFVAATSKSPAAGSDRELVRWAAGTDDGLAYGQVAAAVAGPDDVTLIEVTFPVAIAADDPDERRVGKSVRIDGVARRGMDLLGRLRVALFRPQDLAMVDGPPGERRRYLDVLLCQLDREYCRALSVYTRVLAQRNSLLKALREGRSHDGDELAYWDEQLVTAGARIIAGRAQVIRSLEGIAARLHAELAPGAPLSLTYTPALGAPDRWTADNGDPGVRQAATRSDIESRLMAALQASRRPERARGTTVVGPHRDDLGIHLGEIDVKTYGSRGQQRTAALAIKLAEARVLAERGEGTPVLLLDDIFSELDASRRAFLLSALPVDWQVLVTATDPDRLPEQFAAKAYHLTVQAGEITVVSH